MAKHVRRAFLHRGDPREACLDYLLHLTTRYPTSFVVEEKCGFPFSGLPITLVHIRPEGLFQFLAEWHDALLVSLAGYFQLVIDEIYIPVIQSDKFCQSDARRIEQ